MNGRWRRWWPGSLAGQAIALQIVVIAGVVLGATAVAIVDAARDGDAGARQVSLGVATALADSPSTARAIGSGRATAELQPVTESVRAATGLAFITIMAPDGTRYTHTDPGRIGGRYVGTIAPALGGTAFTEVYTGTLGESVRAIVPVRDPGGRIVGLVAAGILRRSLAARWHAQIPAIAAVSAGALGAALVGVWGIRRRLMRQTRGLRPDELRVMYEHHDAILHAVSEGLIVLHGDGVVLVNDEARRLLGLGAGEVRAEDLPEFLRRAAPAAHDEISLTEDRVLVVNRSPVTGGPPGAVVVTIRDRTELQDALGELHALEGLTDSLRAQAHETANRLHAIVTMVEMGRAAEAVALATDELELSQRLVDRLSAAVGDPVLVALLLGKTAEATARGIDLTVTGGSEPAADGALALGGQELVTVVGNLVDNAMDACDRADPWVEVTVRQDRAALVIAVADSGAGMDAEAFARATRRGFSTKSDGGARGLGLALVTQVLRRHGGTLRAEDAAGTGFASVVTATVPAGGPP